MCRKVTCKKCGKASWAGCGAHVEQVLAGVPRPDRCQCHSGGPKMSHAKRTPAQAPVAAKQSWLDKLRAR